MKTFWTSCLFLAVKGPAGWIQLFAIFIFGSLILLLLGLGLRRLAQPYIDRWNSILASVSRAQSILRQGF
jgi:hypothetical protein